MMGRETASRPTARGTLAVISQGEQKFSLLARRVQETVCAIVTQIKQTYEENMPPDLQTRILGKDGNPKFKYLSPENIAGQYDCKMTLDLTAGDASAERELSTIVYQTMIMSPLVQQNPAFLWEISSGFLKGMGRKNVEQIIGPKPQTTLTEDDADDLFKMLLAEQSLHPKDVIDINAINKLIELKQTSMYQSAPIEARLNVDRYINEAKAHYIEQVRENYEKSSGQETGLPGGQAPASAPRLGVPQGMGSPGSQGPVAESAPQMQVN